MLSTLLLQVNSLINRREPIKLGSAWALPLVVGMADPHCTLPCQIGSF